MRTFWKIIKWTMLAILALLLVIVILLSILYFSADFMKPKGFEASSAEVFVSDSLRTCGSNWLKLDEYGLWEMKVSGDPYSRGEAIGKMSGDLLYDQEKVFVDQIYKLVPSRGYVSFLHKLIIIFNRNLGRNVPEEYRKEIYAVSQYCSHEFDDFGAPYERQMNYHSAHDIGHAMQDYMLVGCSSFSCWGGMSADSSLITGRNFDFYMGDDFAKNKIVLFVSPDKGYRFASVTWPGMMGVLSGMNEKGLTVTINAAKSVIPQSSATPISILAREILQYAGTISEAYGIAQRYKTFVSESILVSSVADGRAVIIEKTPVKIALYQPEKERVVCTNHYQSSAFDDDRRNQENIKMSDSRSRYLRIGELLDSLGGMDVVKSVYVLRDKKGKGGENIGYCNDLAVNQLIAHHSVVFKPGELRMWVSTSPWQCGKYVCYDLNKVFSDSLDYKSDVSEKALDVAEDPFINSEDYRKVLKYRECSSIIRKAQRSSREVSKDSLAMFSGLNPDYYGTYVTLGDYYLGRGDSSHACSLWRKALSLPSKKQEKSLLETKLADIKKNNEK